jgi:hypothetical protein
MKKLVKSFSATTALAVLLIPALSGSASVLAATSPVLGASSGYSVLGGAGVTCTGTTTATGAVGVSTGSSVTGFPSPCTAGGGIHDNDASAIAAQADTLTTYGSLDQTCDHTYGSQDLTLLSPLGPGVYCSTSNFSLSGNLKLTGSGVWIFKTVSTLITSPGSSVTGGDPCNAWWRIGSSATLDTTTSFIGTIIAQNGLSALNTGAALNGRILALTAGSVTLNSSTIFGPTCAAVSSTATTASATKATTPGVPNTGFGVYHISPWSGLTFAAFGAAALLGLALVLRKLSSRQQPDTLNHS